MRAVATSIGVVLCLLAGCAWLKLREPMPVEHSGFLPAPSRLWLQETIRVRRVDADGNPCWRPATFRERFFEQVPDAEACSRLFEDATQSETPWILHYRLVRRRRPILQFDKGEGLSEAQRACVEPEGAPLKVIPIPGEIVFLAPDLRSPRPVAPAVKSDETLNPGFDSIGGIPPVIQRGVQQPLSCHRMELNLTQDEFLEAKLRFPLLVVSARQAAPSDGHWLERLWLAPFADATGLSRGWLLTSVLPATPCRLCLKKAYREAMPPGRARQLESR